MRACAKDFQIRRSMSSHSRLAKKLSAMALSQASPTLPIEGRTPICAERRPNSTLVYWLPWSKWWITPWGLRVSSAMFSAASTRSAIRRWPNAQPTILRPKTSSTTAK